MHCCLYANYSIYTAMHYIALHGVQIVQYTAVVCRTAQLQSRPLLSAHHYKQRAVVYSGWRTLLNTIACYHCFCATCTHNRAIRITNIRALMDTDKLRSDFDRLALGNLRGQVDSIVSDISTLIATRARTQSQAVLDFVSNYNCGCIFVLNIPIQYTLAIASHAYSAYECLWVCSDKLSAASCTVFVACRYVLPVRHNPQRCCMSTSCIASFSYNHRESFTFVCVMSNISLYRASVNMLTFAYHIVHTHTCTLNYRLYYRSVEGRAHMHQR
jgi:hypothetical protein